MTPIFIETCAADEIRRAGYDEIVDVRTPGEFVHDHVPAAINLPVLDDGERHQIGTLYAEDPFKARQLGAALVAHNIGKLIESHFAERPRGYRPLLYCWRGGYRSRSLALVLREIGWKVTVLGGGYRAFRAHVREDLTRRCQQLNFHVISGLTGVGKTRWLETLAARGENVLNLEALGAHRGSLLGDNPMSAQPSQKYFESLIWEALEICDPTREVFVEAESRRLGRLFCPEPLWQAMGRARVTELAGPLCARVDFLISEYGHLCRQPELILERLPVLIGHHSRAQVHQWMTMVQRGQWRDFVASILVKHYDPGYRLCVHFQEPATRICLGNVTASSGFNAGCLPLPPELTVSGARSVVARNSPSPTKAVPDKMAT
ncbi:MAG: tRNA 2-selenouridine(34) synthase MnmH [Verrucomicrobiales bacterium]